MPNVLPSPERVSNAAKPRQVRISNSYDFCFRSAAGARSTGIGCFYDDPVHDVLGLEGPAFQSLYHFTVGVPVEDARLTSEAAYVDMPS